MNNVKNTFKEVVAAIMPVTIVVIFLQIAIIRLPMETLLQFLIGVFYQHRFHLFLLGVNEQQPCMTFTIDPEKDVNLTLFPSRCTDKVVNSIEQAVDLYAPGRGIAI